MDDWLGVAGAGGVFCGEGYDVLEAFYVDLVGRFALEEIGKDGFGECVLVRNRALEGRSRKQKHRFQPHSKLLSLETRQPLHRGGIQEQLQHIIRLVRKRPDESQRVRPLLARRAKDQNGGIVLLGEELERGGVVEGVDGVLLGELLGQGLAQGVEVGEGVLDDLGAG